MELRPVREPFARLLETAFPKGAEERYKSFLEAAKRFAPGTDGKQMSTRLRKRLASLPSLRPDNRVHGFLWLWCVVRSLCPDEVAECAALSWVDEWMLADMMREFLIRCGWSERLAGPAPGLLAFLVRTGERIADVPSWPELLTDPEVQRFLEVNEFKGVRWFSKESMELFAASLAEISLMEGWEILEARAVPAAAEASGYRWNDFLELLPPKHVDPGLKDPE